MTVTTAQLADALGVPKSTAIRRADAAGWTYREECARGGTRRLYVLESLPPALRAQFMWQGAPSAAGGSAPAARAAGLEGRAEAARLALSSGLQAQAAAVRRETALRQAGELSATAQARMDARLAVVRAFELWHAQSALPLEQAQIAFALEYSCGGSDMGVPPTARELVPTVSARSLRHWAREVRTRGIVALAGAYGNRSGSGKVDSQPDVLEFVRAMLVAKPHCRSTQVMKALQARLGGSAALPSMRSLERWISAWRRDNAAVLTALANPDAWRNKYMTAFGSRSADVVRVNQRWELDSSPADVMCTDGRYCLIAGIDVHSRLPRMLVAKTSRADGVAGLLRRMLLDLGVPEQVKTDNGSDYASKHVVRVLAALDVEHRLCDPFSPEQKPHIERFFGTFTRDLAELLPGYIGHSVAERKAIEARRSFAERLMRRGADPVEVKLSGKELQAFCDQWIESVYQHAPHEGLNRRTPFEVAASLGTERRRIDDERALDVLLAAAPDGEARQVQKKGLKVDSAWYIAPELHAWVGERVQVRIDALDHDLGRLYVFGHAAGAGEQSFVCIAECPERTGMDRREVAAKGRALQREHLQAARRALKSAARRVGTDELVQEVLRDRAAAAGKLAVLPGRSTVHSSAGLAAAAAAARAAGTPQRTTADIEQLAEVQAARERIAALQVPKGTANDLATRRGPQPAPTFETVGERVRWLMCQARVRELSAEERESLAEYRRTQPASYRRMQLAVAEEHSTTPPDAAGADGG